MGNQMLKNQLKAESEKRFVEMFHMLKDETEHLKIDCQILKKQLEAQSEVKQNRLSNEDDEPSTKELLALLMDEVKCTKTENQMLVTKLQAQSEKRFVEMFTKLESKLNDLVETTEETKFILQT